MQVDSEFVSHYIKCFQEFVVCKANYYSNISKFNYLNETDSEFEVASYAIKYFEQHNLLVTLYLQLPESDKLILKSHFDR